MFCLLWGRLERNDIIIEKDVFTKEVFVMEANVQKKINWSFERLKCNSASFLDNIDSELQNIETPVVGEYSMAIFSLLTKI